MSISFNFRNFMLKKNENFEYPKKSIKNIEQITLSDKWDQLDSIFHKKNKRIIFFDNDFFSSDEIENDLIQKNTKLENTKTIKNKKINLEYLIHPIDDNFDKFIDQKIASLEQLKNNKYQKKEELNINNENFISNFTLNKYKKQEESIIKDKNEPMSILSNRNNNDLNDKYEFNKMKTKKFFFTESIKNNNTDLGQKNKTRLNNLLMKIKSGKSKNEIIIVPNKFEILNNEEKSNRNSNNNKYINLINHNKEEENRDYFDSILDECKIKIKNKLK